MPRTDDRDQGPCTLTARTQDSPGGGLHSQCSKFGRCDIASEGSRHVVLAAVHTTGALALGRVSALGCREVGFIGKHRQNPKLV